MRNMLMILTQHSLIVAFPCKVVEEEKEAMRKHVFHREVVLGKLDVGAQRHQTKPHTKSPPLTIRHLCLPQVD